MNIFILSEHSSAICFCEVETVVYVNKNEAMSCLVFIRLIPGINSFPIFFWPVGPSWPELLG